MATIKSYSDFQQSKVLNKILSDESADMYYYTVNGHSEWYKTPNILESINDLDMDGNSIPCWSLSALLSVLPKIEHLKPFIDLSPELDSNKVAIYYHSENSPYIVRDNLIDACYEMILKLHELKKL